MTILEIALAAYLGVLGAAITGYGALSAVGFVMSRNRRAKRKAILDDQLVRLRAAAAAGDMKEFAATLGTPTPDTGNVNEEGLD